MRDTNFKFDLKVTKDSQGNPVFHHVGIVPYTQEDFKILQETGKRPFNTVKRVDLRDFKETFDHGFTKK